MKIYNRLIHILIFCLTILFLPALSFANPYSTEFLLGQQYPNTMHAQISSMSMQGYDDWKKHLPIGISRDSQAICSEPVFGDITKNSGSGLSTYSTVQFCECNLLPGVYSYNFIMANGVPEMLDSWNNEPITVRVRIDDPPPDWEENAISDGDLDNDLIDRQLDPWEIPDGPWPKGLNCEEWCKSHPDPCADFPLDEIDGDADSDNDVYDDDSIDNGTSTGDEDSQVSDGDVLSEGGIISVCAFSSKFEGVLFGVFLSILIAYRFCRRRQYF